MSLLGSCHAKSLCRPLTVSHRTPAPFTAVHSFNRGTTVRRAPIERGSLVVVAAEQTKGLDSAEQRNKLAQKARLQNRTRRSAVNTRIKKVIKLAEEYKAKIDVIKSEDDIKPLETLITEAYKEIDKAASKDILHDNNAARKKSRIARYKRDVLVMAGLYTPLPGQPGYKAPKTGPLRDAS